MNLTGRFGYVPSAALTPDTVKVKSNPAATVTTARLITLSLVGCSIEFRNPFP
jgi:hypothetical protein